MSAPDRSGLRPAASTIVTAALAVASIASFGAASAAEVVRYDYQGASAICQPALAAHAAGLRSRPLSLENTGTTAAFVSCALRGDPRAGGRGAMKVLAEVGATGPTGAVVTCTFIDGVQEGGSVSAIYRTKSVPVHPLSRGSTMTWQPVEIAGNPEHIFRPALQCQLPPRTALHYLAVTYDEDIGG